MPGISRIDLQKSEERKFHSRMGRLSVQRTATDIDPAVVGWLNLHDGIWWIALYRDLEGARPFLDAAIYQLSRHADRCTDPPKDVETGYSYFSSHIGAFFARRLSNGENESDWSTFDKAIGLLAWCWQSSEPETDAAQQTPTALFSTALAALASLWRRTLPDSLVTACRTAQVSRHFQALQQSLLAVVDRPEAIRCDDVRERFRQSISIADYRLGLVRGLQLQQLLAVSSVAACGDVAKGAREMFD